MSGDPATESGPVALIVVDVQNDFCEGGSMGVDGGSAVAASITDFVSAAASASGDGRYRFVVATRDWHVDPGQHWANEGEAPDFSVSWPRHCHAGTSGAAFHPDLKVEFDEVFSKGHYSASFSGFEGAAGGGKSADGDGSGQGAGLADWLRGHGIEAVDVVGIATDFCVKATALDARRAGFRTRVLLDHCAGVAPDSTESALAELAANGVELV